MILLRIVPSGRLVCLAVLGRIDMRLRRVGRVILRDAGALLLIGIRIADVAPRLLVCDIGQVRPLNASPTHGAKRDEKDHRQCE